MSLGGDQRNTQRHVGSQSELLVWREDSHSMSHPRSLWFSAVSWKGPAKILALLTCQSCPKVPEDQLASVGLPGKLSQCWLRWGADRALAAPLGLLLTFSLAEVPSLASCELAVSGGMMRGWLRKVPSPLFLCVFGKENWWLSEDILSLHL